MEIKVIQIKPVNIKVREIIKLRLFCINLYNKYLEYRFVAKVQDFDEEGVKSGEERIIDTRTIFFRENISMIKKTYLSGDKVTEVAIDSIGVEQLINIYFRSDEEADVLFEELLNYKLGT